MQVFSPVLVITGLIISLIGQGSLASETSDHCNVSTSAKNLIALCDKSQQQCHFDAGLGNHPVQFVFSSAYQGKIFAESRRLMFEAAPEQQTRCVALSVNVRDPEGQPLKEKQADTPPALDIYFNRDIHHLTGVYMQGAREGTQLFIAGDSTVCDQDPQYDKAPEERFSGWGQFLPKYFNSNLSVVNYADSGEGTAAFRVDGGELWQPIQAQLRAGDWVLIQLGHNDKTTTQATYSRRLKQMIAQIKERDATPVLISPMIRNSNTPLKEQHIWPELNIRQALKQLAQEENVAFIDLMQLSHEWASQLGQDRAQHYFVKRDRTHTNEQGAALFAAMLIEAMQRQKLPLIQYLR